MFNSDDHKWSDVQVAIGGTVITGIAGVKYSVKKEKEYLFGRGETPHAIQSGNKTYEGELLLWQKQLDELQRLLEPEEDLTDMAPFNITVSFVPKSGVGTVTHQLIKAEFTEDSRDLQQGDKFGRIAMPIMFLGRKTT